REEARFGHPAGEQKGGDGGRAHDKGIQNMRVVQSGRYQGVSIERRQEKRIQLVDVRNELPVDAWKGRVGTCDADRQTLVEELVRHHVPVDDASREDGKTRAERKPEGEQREVRP